MLPFSEGKQRSGPGTEWGERDWEEKREGTMAGV